MTPSVDLASTQLRSSQLAKIAAPRLNAAGATTLTSSSIEFKDTVLILSKNFLQTHGAEDIARLKTGGNIIISDPLDGLIQDDLYQASDVLIAASLTQFKALTREYPRHRVAYVGHHVDTRIDCTSLPTDRFRLGYFGELRNAKFRADLFDLVGFHHTDTSLASDTGWMSNLVNYNAHYAVRERQSFDGFKPFTKGFIAAAMQSVVVPGSSDPEAREWLPDDYPYWADDSSAEAVRALIMRMRDEYGGREWERAASMMAHLRQQTQIEVIASQIEDAITPELTGRV